MSAELPPELQPKRDEILRNATTRGMRMRIRRRVALGASVVLAVSAVVGTAAALAGDGHHARVVTSQPEATTATSSAESTSTSVPDSTTAVSTSPTTDVPPTVGSTDTTPGPDTTVPTSDTTALVCHDSYDPRCGPLTFTSTPVNQPLELSVQHTQTGLTVKLHIHASDDAAVDACMRVDWGDGEFSSGPDRFGCVAEGTCARFPDRYGPWDPPPPTPTGITLDFTHEYKAADTFAIAIHADSAVPCSPDQFYASEAGDTLHVTLTSPTTSTTG